MTRNVDNKFYADKITDIAIHTPMDEIRMMIVENGWDAKIMAML